MYIYKTTGTCAREIHFEIVDGKVHNLVFVGGCPGNTLGITKLVEGMDKDKVIELLKGTRCGGKNTSCPDQLACALENTK